MRPLDEDEKSLVFHGVPRATGQEAITVDIDIIGSNLSSLSNYPVNSPPGEFMSYILSKKIELLTLGISDHDPMDIDNSIAKSGVKNFDNQEKNDKNKRSGDYFSMLLRVSPERNTEDERTSDNDHPGFNKTDEAGVNHSNSNLNILLI